MKLFLITICFLTATFSFSQNSFSEADAKQVIDTFFEGFHKGDTLLMKSVMHNDLTLQTTFTTKEGENKLVSETVQGLLKAIAGRPEDQKWDEQLLDYKVQVDGNLAHVWTPYEFWFNGTFSHCGANSFTLVKMDEGWKIIHLIDSRRKNGCQE